MLIAMFEKHSFIIHAAGYRTVETMRWLTGLHKILEKWIFTLYINIIMHRDTYIKYYKILKVRKIRKNYDKYWTYPVLYYIEEKVDNNIKYYSLHFILHRSSIMVK